MMNGWRRFKVRQYLAEVTHRAEQLVFVKMLLQFVPVGQHGRRQYGRIRPKDVGIGWIGWPRHNKADVVACTSEHCSNAFTADTLQPMLVDLKVKNVIIHFPQKFRF
jgi:hypothetical protein